MSIEAAVDRAIDECVREDILREFLERNRAEARAMSIYEYDQEEHIRLEREDAFGDGRKEGEKAHLISLIQKKLTKQKTIEVIAEELEEDVETIVALIKKMKG